MSERNMQELLAVDPERWLGELEGIQAHYAKFGSKVPAALLGELESLEKRLREAV